MEGQGGECPRPGCGGALIPRRGKWGLFWGCSNWSANGCPETRRARTLDKGHAFVVLEAEAVDAFRLYLRARAGGGEAGASASKGSRKRAHTHGPAGGGVGESRAEEGPGAAGQKRQRLPSGLAAGESAADGESSEVAVGRRAGRWVQIARAAAESPPQARQAGGPVRGALVHEAAAAAETTAAAARAGGPSQRDSEGTATLTVESLAALVAAAARVSPMRIDCRPAGPLGAVYPLAHYERVSQALSAAFAASAHTTVIHIPASTLEALRACREGERDTEREESPFKKAMGAREGARGCRSSDDGSVRARVRTEGSVAGDDWERVAAKVPAALRSSLLPYQIAGVRFVLGCKGRALLADDMGLGKTVQALASAAALDAFPLLVVCPATLRLVWAQECEKWLTTKAAVGQLHVIFGHGDMLPQNERPGIVIVSYHMLRILLDRLEQVAWKMVIFDESHSIRTAPWPGEAEQTAAALRLAKGVARILLLSGTPSLTRPFGIFNQIDMLRPGLLGKSKLHFAMAYCPETNAGWGGDARGAARERRASVREGACSRPWELNLLLRETVMIRRLKTQVMYQLPAKRRQLVPIPLAGFNPFKSTLYYCLYTGNMLGTRF
jgi:hypothetical protein